MSLKTDEAALGALIEVQRSVGRTDLSPERLAEIQSAGPDRVRFEFAQRAEGRFEEYIILGESVRHYFESGDHEPMREALAAIEALP